VAARDRWCHHVPPATAQLACGGDRHTVTWRRGKLVLEDHDLGAERAMLALGGEMPACLATLQLWRNLHTWAMAGELFGQLRARLGDDALFGPGELAEAHQLGLALTWERAWRRAGHFTDHGRLLAEQLRPRALPPLREHLRYWLRRHGSRRLSSVEVEPARDGPAGMLTGEMDSVGVRAVATLSARWLVRVWGRGLAVVDGAFVVDVDDAAGPPLDAAGVAVRAVRWSPDPGRPGCYVPVEEPAVARPDGRLTWRP